MWGFRLLFMELNNIYTTLTQQFGALRYTVFPAAAEKSAMSGRLHKRTKETLPKNLPGFAAQDI